MLAGKIGGNYREGKNFYSKAVEQADCWIDWRGLNFKRDFCRHPRSKEFEQRRQGGAGGEPGGKTPTARMTESLRARNASSMVFPFETNSPKGLCI